MRLLALGAMAASLLAAPRQTALDRYVQTPDPSYRFELKDTTSGANGTTIHLLDLTSQTWRKPDEVDRPVWKHWLRILKPQQVRYRTGLLFITGGSNNSQTPRALTEGLEEIAAKTNSIVAELRMVPNQPLTFPGEKPRVEDEFIAYTWDRYLRTGDDRWLARLPMTKSAVRAMDAVTQFLASSAGGGIAVDRFVVSGASKRGWTTWTTGAVDPRVVGIIPLVIDTLNVEVSFNHHWRVYGFFSPAVGDYEAMGIPKWFGTPQYRALLDVEDPYSYRDRLTMPKFIINAAGDQYFLPDSWRFYWHGLKGRNYLRYVPNSDHSMRGTDVFQSLLAWYDSLLRSASIPTLTWSLKGGTLQVRLDQTAREVRLWSATNPDARDFRVEKIGRAWKSELLNGSREFAVPLSKPEKGFSAYLVEATFDTGSPYPLKLTTGVYVTPDVYPFPPRKAQ